MTAELFYRHYLFRKILNIDIIMHGSYLTMNREVYQVLGTRRNCPTTQSALL